MKNSVKSGLFRDINGSVSFCVILDVIVIFSSYALYYDIHEQLHPNDFYFHLFYLLAPLTLINFAIGFFIKEKKSFFYAIACILLSLLMCSLIFLFIAILFSSFRT